MPTVTGIIEVVSVQERKTQWGVKNATSFKLGENWYSGGFKEWEVEKGDDVQLSFEVNPKGFKDVTTIAVVAKGAPPPVTKAQSGAPRGGRSFPMDALDPGRVIVRQNALAHAVNTAIHNSAKVAVGGTVTTEEVIGYARQYEAYACGDLDEEEAEAMMAGNPDPNA